MARIEFNNGFITAITLFLEHKNFISHQLRDKENKIISDLRLYCATDHLYDLEIPKKLPKILRNRILRWRHSCFHHRMDSFKSNEIPDKLFKEAEQILKAIDEQIFKTKKVVIRYR
jgi:hypothetical protein